MQLNPRNTNVTAAVGAKLTAAALGGNYITRSGPVAPFTDTLESTATILSLLTGLPVGFSFVVAYVNSSTQTATIAAADAGTEIIGSPAVGPSTLADMLFTVTGRGTISVQFFIYSAQNRPGGQGVEKFVGAFSGVSEVTLTHNLGTTDVQVQAYDAMSNLVIPQSVSVVDSNSIELQFGAPFSGFAVIIG